MNTDGAVKGSSSAAAAGGLLRYNRGLRVKGFLLNIFSTCSIMAELWGVREGLLLASSIGIQEIILIQEIIF